MTRLILVGLFNVSITYTDRACDLEVADCVLTIVLINLFELKIWECFHA